VHLMFRLARRDTEGEKSSGEGGHKKALQELAPTSRGGRFWRFGLTPPTFGHPEPEASPRVDSAFGFSTGGKFRGLFVWHPQN